MIESLKNPKVAFDVKGTLVGHSQDKVLRLFHFLERQGCELYVWSNSINYAFEAVSQHKLNVDAEHTLYKYSTYEAKAESLPVMTFAIEDDRSQTYLAAEKVVFVDEIPETYEAFAEFCKNLLKGRL